MAFGMREELARDVAHGRFCALNYGHRVHGIKRGVDQGMSGL